MVQPYVELTEAQLQALGVLAAKAGVPVAELVRRGVDQIIRSYGGTSLAERRQRALRAVGGYHSGHHDVSIRHDEHLAEALKP
jgi:hypothetical protein